MPEEAESPAQRELTPEEIEALLGQAGEAQASAGEAPAEGAPAEDASATRPAPVPRVAEEAPAPAELPELAASAARPLVSPERLLEFLGDVPLEITIELGRARLTIGELISLSEGSVVELDKLAGEPVDILANGMLVARGEVVVVNEYFSVRVTEIVSEEEAGAS